jgi:hypothetical protein
MHDESGVNVVFSDWVGGEVERGLGRPRKVQLAFGARKYSSAMGTASLLAFDASGQGQSTEEMIS